MTTARPPLRRRLESLDKRQLIVLVERLVSRHPDLERLAHLPLDGEDASVDSEEVSTQVRAIVLAVGDNWRLASAARHAIWPFREIAQRYEQRGELNNARAVYFAIITAILDSYEQFRDEESQVGEHVLESSTALGALLSRAIGTAHAAARTQILANLWHVIRWEEVETGGYGLGSAAVEALVEHATLDERRSVANLLRGCLQGINGEHRRIRMNGAGKVALELLGEVDDQTRLAILTESAQHQKLVATLIAHGDVDAALALLPATDETELIACAKLLVGAGRAEEAIAVVLAHSSMVLGGGYAEQWLEEHGVGVDPRFAELRELLRRFCSNPGIGRYDAMMELAVACDRRDAVLERAMQELNRNPHARANFSVRARVLAARNEIDEAVALLDQLNPSDWKRAALCVAGDAARCRRVDVARDLYTRVLSQLKSKGTNPARGEAKELEKTLQALR